MAKFIVKAYGDEDSGLRTKRVTIDADDIDEAQAMAWELFPEYDDISVRPAN